MPQEYFGIDIGDGETAVAYVLAGSDLAPDILSIDGQQSLITALGVSTDGTRRIGDAALMAVRDPATLRLRFKSQFLIDPDARQWMEAFAQTLRERLEAMGRPAVGSQEKYFIGCPSGWDETARADYLRVMEQAGFANATIVSESRAALIYAREAGELRMTADQLYRPLLIIDGGSSTTDYTYVADLEIRDWGEVRLGGGTLDELLLAENIKRQPERLSALLDRQPQLRARCEVKAREVKEMYFSAQARGDDLTYPIEDAIKLRTEPPMLVSIECDDWLMEDILSRKLDMLDGMNHRQRYRRSLEAQRAEMDEMPEVVLLTGGATNMPFMGEIAGEVFPGAAVIKGVAPEFAIARGLCYALRMDERRAGFLADVEALIASEEVERVVSDNLASLFERLAPQVVDVICTDLVPDVFRRWRGGEIETLDAMKAQMRQEGETLLQSEDMRRHLQPVVAAWLQTLQPQLERLTNPICDRYGLPRTSLALPDFINVRTGLPFDPDTLLDFTVIKVIIDVVVATVVAVLAGGAETALLAAGPLGLAIGAVIGLVMATLGGRLVEQRAMKANLPTLLRRGISEDMITRSLEKRRGEMTRSMTKQLTDQVEARTLEILATVDGIAQTLEAQLRAEMEKAILLIK